MSCRLRLSTVSPLDTRNDLHLTTTGVGHAFRPSVTFPPLELKSKLLTLRPLPDTLAATKAVPPSTVYTTTTATAHDYKHNRLEDHSICKKAPSLTKVKHTLDTIEKFNQKPWRRTLTMANQQSETHDKFAAKPDLLPFTLPQLRSMPATLSDHHSDGPMKELSSTTENNALKNRQFVPQDQAILDRLEPYMTTNNWYHRTFSKLEQSKGRYPRKDVATYWQCEDYPKAWGHGMKKNPLPKRLCRIDSQPMTDRSVFGNRTIASVGQPKPRSVQLVNDALKSQYQTSYTNHPEEKLKDLFYCPVQQSYRVTNDDVSLLQSVPNMYDTCNTLYGREPPYAPYQEQKINNE